VSSAAYGAAMVGTSSVWVPQITGNVIVVGYRVNYMYVLGEATPWKVVQNGISFATSTRGKTGAYISLSCSGVCPSSPPSPGLL
jgi:hypothetical protein